MPQKKGCTGNPNGRPKGSPNRSTTEIKELFSHLLDSNINRIQVDLDSLEAKDRLNFLLKLSEYVLPKMQSIAFNPEKPSYLSFESLSDEELDKRIAAANRIINK
ncbi:MAG: hypothetical protein P4L28_10810 [Paludibacteraceae bacterium]|nr:hypothetical protein [Paludibacteraceae bacterium]